MWGCVLKQKVQDKAVQLFAIQESCEALETGVFWLSSLPCCGGLHTAWACLGGDFLGSRFFCRREKGDGAQVHAWLSQTGNPNTNI